MHANKIDDIITAEIPNQQYDPELHSIVTKNMIHGPCGIFNSNAPCMKDGKCTKHFPKPFLNDTQCGSEGYPKYRRRRKEDGGEEFTKTIKKTDITLNNRWVSLKIQMYLFPKYH